MGMQISWHATGIYLHKKAYILLNSILWEFIECLLCAEYYKNALRNITVNQIWIILCLEHTRKN